MDYLHHIVKSLRAVSRTDSIVISDARLAKMSEQDIVNEIAQKRMQFSKRARTFMLVAICGNIKRYRSVNRDLTQAELHHMKVLCFLRDVVQNINDLDKAGKSKLPLHDLNLEKYPLGVDKLSIWRKKNVILRKKKAA